MTEQTPRAKHLNWCKQRALEYVEMGDLAAAKSSMLSDLTKFDKPLYDPELFKTLAADGIRFRSSPADVRNWIEGFN